MDTMTSHHLFVLLLSLGVLLAVARVLGELAQRFRQPAVMGELIAGILLGPTVMGALMPELNAYLFPMKGLNAIALDTISNMAIVLFLLVAGMEVDLSTLWKQGRIGYKVGITSIVIPFCIAFTTAFAFPEALGRHLEADPLIFALFLAIAVSISALPIIAKILMDMGLYRSDLGMVAISAAIFNDLVGWMIFAVILTLIDGHAGNGNSILLTISLTLAFVIAVLTLGRWLIHKALPFVQAYTRWPGGELSFALVLGLFGAAFTEWIGIHAIFGAFIVGAAIGDSPHLRERSRVIIEDFISFIFAPVFFASIGLKVNFLTHFDLWLALTVTMIACVCKFAGGAVGARWGGLHRREACAVGFTMISVGTMGIIIGILAFEAGIIRQRLFVALIVMAIFTSMISGPAIRMTLHIEKRLRLRDMLSSKLFLKGIRSVSRRGVIDELTQMVSAAEGLDASSLAAAVWDREEALSTGIGNGVALPHARIKGLGQTQVVVGLSSTGIDFDAPDNRPVHVIFLILTPAEAPDAQLQLAAEIARLFRHKGLTERALRAENVTDFLALLRSGI